MKGIAAFWSIKIHGFSGFRLPGFVNPIYMRKGTSDIGAFSQVILGGEYDIKFNSTPKTIIDGGANIGFFSIYMKNRFPDASIICVEPDSDNFEHLTLNTKSFTNIYLEKAGIWSKTTRLSIADKYNMGKWGMVVQETDDENGLPAISLGDIMEKYKIQQIDILKLDIETSEKEIFREGYEKWLPKVKMIIIELHDWMEPGCSKPFFEAINKTFHNYSYSSSGENTIIVNHDFEQE